MIESAPLRNTRELYLSLPCEAITRSRSCASQEENSLENLTILALWSGNSSLQNFEQLNVCFLNYPVYIFGCGSLRRLRELPTKINFNAAFLIINLGFVRVGFLFLDREYKALERLIPLNLWMLIVTSYLCSQSHIHTVLPIAGAVANSSCPVTPLGIYMHCMGCPRWDSGKESACQMQETQVRSLDWDNPLV